MATNYVAGVHQQPALRGSLGMNEPAPQKGVQSSSLCPLPSPPPSVPVLQEMS